MMILFENLCVALRKFDNAIAHKILTDQFSTLLLKHGISGMRYHLRQRSNTFALLSLSFLIYSLISYFLSIIYYLILLLLLL